MSGEHAGKRGVLLGESTPGFMALQLPGGEQLHVRRSQLRLALAAAAAAEGPAAAARVAKRPGGSSSGSSSAGVKRRAPALPPERAFASAAPLTSELARAAMAKAAAIAAAAELVQAESANQATEMAAVAVALGGSPSPTTDSSPSPPPQHPHQRPPCISKACSTPGCNLQDNHLGGHSNEIADTRQLSPAPAGGTILKRRKRGGAVTKNALLRSRTSTLVLAPLSPHVVG